MKKTDRNKNTFIRPKKIAIVLAAGRGNRMNSAVAKQYLEIAGNPLVYYSLKIFEESDMDEIILVVPEEDLEYCRINIVAKYGFRKVKKIIPGGKERYNSVFYALESIQNTSENTYVFIHDGARPCLTEDIVTRCCETVEKTNACVAAVPVKDTIKIVGDAGYISSTPARNTLWQIQTPQAFSYELIKKAYDLFLDSASQIQNEVTDDAMIIERFTETSVKVVEGTYANLKVTTPEDLQLARIILEREN